MNEGITHFLNQYLESSAPGYAVLLKGNWGAGKSFFVRKWIQSLKEEESSQSEESNVFLKPIYVSLYGLKSVQEIQECIRRELYPVLYSKGATLIKAILRGVSAIAAKKDQWDGVEDLLSILSNEDKRIKGTKLLVFDDFERARLDMKECMGCINYYVEQCGCKVIIVSNERKIQDPEYFEIKEKTVGREFEVLPDIDSALDSFISKSTGIAPDSVNLLKEFRPHIVDVFRCSGTGNLRVLHQALLDYEAIVREFEVLYSYKNRRYYQPVMRQLIENLLAVYLEYKAGNRVLEDWQSALKNTANASAITFRRKYSSLEGSSLFSVAWVEKIMDYLQLGSFDLVFLQGLFVQKTGSSWAQLDRYLSLGNEEFIRLVSASVNALKTRKISDISEVLHADANLLKILQEKDLKVDYSEQDILDATEKFFLHDLEAIADQQRLLEYKKKVLNWIAYYQKESILSSFETIGKIFMNHFQKRASEVKNPLAILLESITDSEVDDVVALLTQTAPEQSVTYDETAIFEYVNPKKFAISVGLMTNAGRQDLRAVLNRHYIHSEADLDDRFLPDAEVLYEAVDILEKRVRFFQGLDLSNYRHFLKALEGFANQISDNAFIRAKKAGKMDIVTSLVDEPFSKFMSSLGDLEPSVIEDLWEVSSGVKADSSLFVLEKDNGIHGTIRIKRVGRSEKLQMPPAFAKYFPTWLEEKYQINKEDRGPSPR